VVAGEAAPAARGSASTTAAATAKQRTGDDEGMTK